MKDAACYSLFTALLWLWVIITVYFHSGFVDEIYKSDVDLTDIVRAELVLILDPEDQLLCVVANGHAEELIPLGTQVVVDYLG